MITLLQQDETIRPDWRTPLSYDLGQIAQWKNEGVGQEPPDSERQKRHRPGRWSRNFGQIWHHMATRKCLEIRA